jgi:hypothetical protein
MKLKNLVFAVFATVVSLPAFAQEEPRNESDVKESKFKKENLFTGGNLTLQFGNITTTLGVSPYFGYSLTNWLDVAASLNFNYTSQRDNVVVGDKIRQTVYGPGAFVRIFPVNFLFVQGHFEQNFIKLKYIPADNSGYSQEKQSLDASSFLVGGGYAGGRNRDSKSFYYISVFWDVAKNQNSPYLDNQRRTVPIIRAGYNIALFQGYSGRRDRD